LLVLEWLDLSSVTDPGLSGIVHSFPEVRPIYRGGRRKYFSGRIFIYLFILKNLRGLECQEAAQQRVMSCPDHSRGDQNWIMSDFA